MTGHHSQPPGSPVGDGPASPDEPQSTTAPAVAAVQEGFTAFQQALRHRLRALVVDDQLAVNDANRLLTAVGEPSLRRQWTVDVTMTFRCDVTAGSAPDAVQAAEELIADAVDAAGPLPVELLRESRVSSDPAPGDLDRDNP